MRPTRLSCSSPKANCCRRSIATRLTSLMLLLDYLGGRSDSLYLSAREYRHPLASYSLSDPIYRIQSYLINHHKDTIRLSSLADSLHLNITSMCRLYKQRTGKTIISHLAEIRVECARKLLSTTDLTVTQIAFESGFGNQAHFNKQFRRITGQTPTDYRRTLRRPLNPY